MASTSQGPPALNYVISGGQWVPWDGAITVPPITIGTVDQGAAGSDPWAVAFLTPQHVIVDSGGGGAVTIADGADVTQGALNDAAVQGNVSGSVNARLRGISVLWNDVWNSVSHFLRVNVENASLAVTKSGTWLVDLISGQTGITGGAGAVAANTPRVVLATDTTVPNVTGNIANDAADSGNPVKVGGKAATSLPTAMSAADRTDLLCDVYGRPFVRHGAQGPATGFWNAQHAPAANTKATITKAAGASGVRNVCTSITVVLAAGATAPAAIQVSVALIDGASGGTTYLWGPNVISLPAVAGATSAFVIGQCWKPGTAATAMTLEFSAAGGANTIESVSMDGTTVAE